MSFTLNHIVASSLYGRLPLAEILPEVRRFGSEILDIWPEKHANQREQADDMGLDAFGALLEEHGVRLGISTRFDLGARRLQEEMGFARRFGAQLLVCGSGGPKGLTGDELRDAVRAFAEEMAPHIDAAGQHDLRIAIENHGNALIESPDSMKWLLEFTDSPHLGIALAPYHLPDDAALVASTIGSLGDGLALFYAWQHGMGCHEPLPKEQELLQLPGRGSLDFAPVIAALKAVGYTGWTEIFMHPVPRGIPILDTAAQVTDELLAARRYLDDLAAAA
jgi:sugar phosphate isomerase/epimerase